MTKSQKFNLDLDHLNAPTRRWVLQVNEDYDLKPHHQRLLMAAADAWDALIDARNMVEKFGILIKTQGGNSFKQNPATRLAIQHRMEFSRLVAQLNLDEDDLPSPVAIPGARSHHKKGSRKW